MIEYFERPSFHIAGPITLQAFGLLVATGILLGAWLIQRRSIQAGINTIEIRAAIAWSIAVGFFISHIVAIIYYKPERMQTEGPALLFFFWDGISSYGGFFGAFAGLFIFYGKANRPAWMPALSLISLPAAASLCHFNVLLGQIAFGGAYFFILYYYWPPVKSWLRDAEVILHGLVVGWVFGRMGCTVAFDHPGSITDFFLAFQFGSPTGPFRHNLGLYEMLYTLVVLLPLTFILHRRNPPVGVIMGVICCAYAPIRFVLDYLRATDIRGADVRYLGLTPAQYASIVLFFFGIAFVVMVKRRMAKNPSYPRVIAPPEEQERARQESIPKPAKTKRSPSKPRAKAHSPQSRRHSKRGRTRR